ncbi:phosphoribosyltransferase [Xanthomonas fragariae]|nr:phosphoribosyltransferase [Xanthomonas fragariae]WIY72360.1 phosphoribosyltransferase [Xanthomonas fragariae]
MPPRKVGDSAAAIFTQHQVKPHETVLLGATKEDMIAGVHNKLLHIRCDWYGQQCKYGLAVPDVSALRRFCLVFALRQHSIYWKHLDNSLDISAAGPYSTKRPDYALFGGDARDAAKYGAGHPDFWFLIVASSAYFSGSLVGVDYICSYPGHKAGYTQPAPNSQAAVLARLGQCLNISYYHDLILRHLDSNKSQPIPALNRSFLNQLNTIHLNKKPRRNLSVDARKTTISLRDKLILVVDDITTSGKSLDTARAYIEAAGGKARLFSWLKTIHTSYTRMNAPELSPYKPNAIVAEPSHANFGYDSGVVDPKAPTELDSALREYVKLNGP